MKQIIMYETADGMKHHSAQAATRHLENLYYPLLHKIAHDVANLNPANGTGYLNEHMETLNKAARMKEDIEYIEHLNGEIKRNPTETTSAKHYKEITK